MIEMGKKYQTRDGKAVRILCTDLKGGWICVVGAIAFGKEDEMIGVWSIEGYAYPRKPNNINDLVPVPTKHEGWGIIIKSGSESVDIAGQINVWLTSSREDTEYKIRQQPEKNWHLAHVTWED